jgi:hypothetical protein
MPVNSEGYFFRLQKFTVWTDLGVEKPSIRHNRATQDGKLFTPVHKLGKTETFHLFWLCQIWRNWGKN